MERAIQATLKSMEEEQAKESTVKQESPESVSIIFVFLWWWYRLSECVFREGEEESSEEDENTVQENSQQRYQLPVFKDKKEATEAFKELLRDKVS